MYKIWMHKLIAFLINKQRLFFGEFGFKKKGNGGYSVAYSLYF
jgi:hypothetical protein